YKHNPTVTLMRTTVEENEQIGRAIASKVNMSIGPCAVMLPLKGVSMIDAEGQPFYGPEEDAALFQVLRDEIDPTKAELIEMDAHVNDDEFAIAAAQKLIDLMNQ
ncbi:MAG: Tm-1-like ATP-binding domain-containing protein, partial [Eggerthellaceae bacterium]|nr:Tm-1-like ATP-binding domain-containing protein [Eggerthellaceae bacterium]